MVNQDENKQKNTFDIWNPIMKRYEPDSKINEEYKRKINNEWCDYMTYIFEKYRDEFEKTIINIPEKTAEIFKNNGIDVSGISQNDIYNSFDEIISSNKHIEDYLKKQRRKYNLQMPF